MDLNDLLFHHQLSLMRERYADSEEARQSQACCTQVYARRIDLVRKDKFPTGRFLKTLAAGAHREGVRA